MNLSFTISVIWATNLSFAVGTTINYEETKIKKLFDKPTSTTSTINGRSVNGDRVVNFITELTIPSLIYHS